MFDIKEIYQPKSLEEALALAAQHAQAVVIAGGTDVLIQVRQGKLAYRDLLSIHGLKELMGIEEDTGGDLFIGPLSSFRELEEHPLINLHIPILAQAAATVGSPQIRAMGTLGGTVINCVTSSDTISTLHVLEAELLVQNTVRQRLLPIKEFYFGPGRTAREPAEIITKIIIRRAAFLNSGGCYLKYAMREAIDKAALGCAVLVWPDTDGRHIERIRIAFGITGAAPMSLVQAEKELNNLSLGEALRCITKLIRTEINQRVSWRATRELRLQIAGALAERALTRAWLQALKRRHI